MNNRLIIIISAVVLGVVVLVSLPKSKSKSNIESSVGQTVARADQPNKISADQLYKKAENLAADKKTVEAKAVYQAILSDYSDFEKIEQTQENLEAVNLDLIFSNSPSEHTIIHEVVSGDTLGKLANTYGTTVALIKRKSHLKSDVIRIGQRLSIWTGQFNVYVDKSQNILLLKAGDEVLKVYNVSTGKDNSTPVGTFKITSKLIDPVWFNRGVVVPPESPDNVLGSRWLGFDIPGYGIHGTVNPEKIGQQVTAGCVRMLNEEVEEIYEMLPLKTQVVIVD